MTENSAREREPLNTEEKEQNKNGGFKNYCDVFKHISVEPAGAVFLTAAIFSMVCSQTLQLEKTCRVNLNLGDEICTSLRNQDSANNSVYERQVQQYVTRRLAFASALQSLLPCFILLFVGAWSDRTGKRITLMVVPMIGMILVCLSNIINVFFFYDLPVEVQIFSDVILLGVAGGWSTLFLGMFSYIADVTTEENRTYRLGFVQFFTFLGMPLGLGLSGIVLKNFGYYVVYGSTMTLLVLNLIYIKCKVKDPQRTEEQKKVIPMIQISAQMLICLNNQIQCYFMMKAGLYIFVASEALLEGLGGGYASVYMAVVSFIARVTSVEERTFRIGLLYFSQSVAIPVGLAIGGPLLKHYGYYWCYILSGCLNLINIIYNSWWIHEAEKSTEQKQHDGKGFLYFVRLFFDLTNIKETIRVVFKKGPNKRRLRICVMLSIVSILFGPMYGELAVLYMSTRYRFGWDELQFSVYQTYNFITHTVGTVFSLVVLSKLLKWHDSVLGIISTLSKIAGSFIYCFAKTPQIFFLAPLVEILNGTSLLAMRSIMSKLVAPDELGKVNSIFGLTENLMPLIYVPLYTTVYTSTMEVLPGAVFLMGASMTIPAVAVFFWLLYDHRKGVRRLEKEETEANGVLEPLKGTEEIPLNENKHELS